MPVEPPIMCRAIGESRNLDAQIIGCLVTRGVGTTREMQRVSDRARAYAPSVPQGSSKAWRSETTLLPQSPSGSRGGAFRAPYGGLNRTRSHLPILRGVPMPLRAQIEPTAALHRARERQEIIEAPSNASARMRHVRKRVSAEGLRSTSEALFWVSSQARS